MKNIYTLLLIVLVSTALLSCTKDFLDKTPDEDLTVAQVFADKNYAERWLYSCYVSLPLEINPIEGALGFNPFTGSSDDMEITSPAAASQILNNNSYSPANFLADYQYHYQVLRKINLFLENIGQTPVDQVEKNKMIGEALFLRAFFHFMSFRMYGPTIIADKAYKTDDDFVSLDRSPVADVVGFMTADLDQAASLLDQALIPSKFGLANGAAALALKSRILLYAASPLYNGNPKYASFKNRYGQHLFLTNFEKDRWAVAAKAAKECIEKAEAAGYILYTDPSNDPVLNYSGAFNKNWNSEIFFAKNLGNYQQQEKWAYPYGFGGQSQLCPTQEIVNDYEMSNGLAITENGSGYIELGYAAANDPKGRWLAGTRNMYVNREPRFYASIIYNGSYFKTRQVQFWNSGLDGKSKSPAAYAKTGYLMKKFIDMSVDIPKGVWAQKTWVYLRLNEVYLNYAEALNESEGPVSDVYKYINLIRNRSGLPNLPANLTQDQMRERIRHERRIELAFDTHRYFDINRWLLAETLNSQSVTGMNTAAGTSLSDNSFYIRTEVEKRSFTSPRNYFFPYPQAVLTMNRDITQTPYW
ncbi:RagB/SusD family nutrient uptake outer membrane protein [Pedobacter heparinus]|uniref:RagB/SusD domain protein n=1 Tax=Pedobacter heparinus (strain ATCC 13125 / DSM 2366 / CIP 104194 / JCM 7457 / NBRC 12017 / NCIMB 9290 / NRRL B-14731 / HIM 762-3) TaxID=485917 RepID=C6Y0C9_PEDHD|nr:RagB/SusD family nutrient uptake outer membrane protein [Pedobacter heparinus]ACU04841.1 RagB/SusD domain protein [Pedobacter heparinus DSM 2366]